MQAEVGLLRATRLPAADKLLQGAGQVTTQIVEQLFSAVHHIPEAREAMAEQLRLVAMQIHDQANGVIDSKSGCRR